MVKKILLFRMVGLVLVFCVVILGCASSPAEVEINNSNIAGTWAYTSNTDIAIYHFSPSGQGREMIIDQSSGFRLLFIPFEYTLTTKTIRQVNVLMGLRAEQQPMQYQLLSSGGDRGLRIVNYLDGFSPVFLMQNLTPVEGIWQRTNDDGDLIEYIFSGGVLTKVQNGRPFAFGRLDVSGSTLILTEQARFLELEDLRIWIGSSVPPETLQYQLVGNTLSWINENGRRIEWIKQ